MQWSNVFKQDLSSREYFGEVCFIVTNPSCLWMDGVLPELFIVHAGLQRWLSYPDHDDVIKWKHFPRYWPFVQGIHRSPVNSPHKGQWRGTLMFSLICVWINGWVNSREAGDLRRYRAHYDVTVMSKTCKHVRNLSPLSASTSKYAESWEPIVTDFTFLIKRIK